MSEILLSPAQADPALLPLQNRPLASEVAATATIPWTIWFAVGGIAMTLAGGSWDFAWHMSIGRETFWTPAHIMVQLGGILVGIASGYTIFSTTFGKAARDREFSVRMLGLYGPAGALLAFWGSIAMVSSAPFDNWWHNAYGLDVKLVTPPHLWLALGWFATKLGTMTWMAGMINRSTEALQTRLTWLLLLVGAICVAHLGVLSLDQTQLRLMHTAYCYLAVAIFNPTMIIAAGRGSHRRWGCTLVGAIYTALALAAEWLLPLVPAQPKLGPVYQKVTHLIPLRFPLLLIVPALVADLLLQRLEGRSAWNKAVIVGPAFVLSFMAVQWPFANFLISPASRNWIFGTAYFPYFEPAGILYDPYKLRATEKPVAFALTMLAALVVSILTARAGVAWGDWMRRVRR
jgi:hypothetical protein